MYERTLLKKRVRIAEVEVSAYTCENRKIVTRQAHAYVNLLLAIRGQAIKDNALKDWEIYWLCSPEMMGVWSYLQAAVEQSQQDTANKVAVYS